MNIKEYDFLGYADDKDIQKLKMNKFYIVTSFPK